MYKKSPSPSTPFGLICLLVLTFVAACNIYAPFNTSGSTEDWIEEARKCLHKNDFACAISNYQQLPDGDLKNQKLCMAYLSKAGATLNVLLNVVTKNDSQMLGSLATALVPWNETKTSDAVSAKTYCSSFGNSSSAGSNGALLKTLGLMVDCATRLSKTDQYVGADTNDTVCTTTGNRNSQITKSDVESSGSAVMCSADVTTCSEDFKNIDGSQLASAGLSNIKSAIDAMPAGITNSAVTTVIRAALKDAVQAD